MYSYYHLHSALYSFYWTGVPVVGLSFLPPVIYSLLSDTTHLSRTSELQHLINESTQLTDFGSSLATRGAVFGDGSTYITYRNVSACLDSSIISRVLTACFLLASHPKRHRRSRCIDCRLSRRGTHSSPARNPRSLYWYARLFIVKCHLTTHLTIS